MQTVIQVSLSGHSKAFQLEEEAYTALHAYLERARSRLKRDPDYEEVLRDLEQSIGEKLAHSLRAENRVISRDRKSTRLNSSHERLSRMPSSA